MPMEDQVADLFGVPRGSALLQQALTHPSYANEDRDARHYQRLEFLGDSILGLCAAELLFERFPDADEGSLTRLRARLVNAEALSAWARAAGIGEALRLGRGAEASGLRGSTSVLCDLVEAILGVAFLEGGLEGARRACHVVVGDALRTLEGDGGRDPKSELQERAQRLGMGTPSYEVVESGGSSHEPWFVVTVNAGGRVLGEARGRSKRLSERAAAEIALSTLAESGDPSPPAAGHSP